MVDREPHKQRIDTITREFSALQGDSSDEVITPQTEKKPLRSGSALIFHENLRGPREDSTNEKNAATDTQATESSDPPQFARADYEDGYQPE